ncbi:hypothetical protein B0H14DRAFT_3436212 [Mycena olivaceomarginata]|nr:hypothetical protein B0H14DRAFT_3436212 [Mycena olivaceomarginata]
MALSTYYLNRKWLDRQRGRANRARYRESGYTQETPSEYFIRKTELLNTVYTLDDSGIILEVMDGAPSTWNTVLTTQSYRNVIEFQAAIRYHEDALMRLDKAERDSLYLAQWQDIVAVERLHEEQIGMVQLPSCFSPVTEGADAANPQLSQLLLLAVPALAHVLAFDTSNPVVQSFRDYFKEIPWKVEASLDWMKSCSFKASPGLDAMLTAPLDALSAHEIMRSDSEANRKIWGPGSVLLQLLAVQDSIGEPWDLNASVKGLGVMWRSFDPIGRAGESRMTTSKFVDWEERFKTTHTVYEPSSALVFYHRAADWTSVSFVPRPAINIQHAGKPIPSARDLPFVGEGSVKRTRDTDIEPPAKRMKDDLQEAQSRIFEQESIIRQKNQRINRLVRDKSILAAKQASVKQQLLAAVLRAEAAEKLSKSEALRMESLISTISRLDGALDGTSHRNIKYEARHVTSAAPTYSTDPTEPKTTFRTRVVEVDHALDHTAQSQYEVWEVATQKIAEIYSKSPLARRDSVEGYSFEADDLWRKYVAYSSDHAADVRLAAAKCIDKKQLVVEGDLGNTELAAMTDAEVEVALWEVVKEMCDDPDGLDPRSLLEDLRAEAVQSLAAHMGSQAFNSLPESRQELLTRVVVAGCCEHKDHNCTRAGVDNAATIALGENA